MTGLRGRPLWIGTALVFVVALNAFLFVVSPFEALYDTDSYYHLQVARAYAEHGNLREFPWARTSLLTKGFGDKEVIFHLLLIPFATLQDPTAGGKAALALLNACAAALVGFLAMRALGRVGALMPFWMFGTATELMLRTLRLRPEILSLILFLLALDAAAARRHRTLGVLAFLYVFSYTAFHVFLGLCGLWFLYGWIVERRREWGIVVYPVLGAGVAVLVHPQFPANLRLWWFVAVEFFLYKDALDVGPEIQSQILFNFVALGIGWLAGLAVLWRSREEAAETNDSRAADLAAIGAAVFCALYVAGMRFAVYSVPFLTIAVLYRIAQGGGLGRFTRLPFRGRVPFALAFGACFLFSLYSFKYVLINLRGAGVFRRDLREDAERFGKAVPAGAKVAAPWGEAESYMFWAPQGRYLNVLDPGLMAVPFPAAFNAQRALFAGDEPDPPFAIRTRLDSDFVAFVKERRKKLADQLAADPRVQPLVQGADALYRILPAANGRFVLDWRLAPPGTPTPPPADSPIETWRPYPRAAGEAGGVEGYVDGRRLLREPFPCVAFVHEENVSSTALVTYELAPYGPTAFFLDGKWVGSAQGQTEAVLGKGLVLPLSLSAGTHRLTVGTCPVGKQLGFYLLERGREEEKAKR